MAKAVFWRSDWFLGVVVTLLMVLAGHSDLLQSLERKAYDMGFKHPVVTRPSALLLLQLMIRASPISAVGLGRVTCMRA